MIYNLNKDESLIRYDFVSRILLNLIKKLIINNHPKWIEYNENMAENRNIIKIMENLSDKSINDLISFINDISINF